MLDFRFLCAAIHRKMSIHTPIDFSSLFIHTFSNRTFFVLLMKNERDDFHFGFMINHILWKRERLEIENHTCVVSFATIIFKHHLKLFPRKSKNLPPTLNKSDQNIIYEWLTCLFFICSMKGKKKTQIINCEKKKKLTFN